ncbi:tetratricopeptide repeat protein [Winogradskyella sp. 3972H.M.0a.05]|uniref:tetratricopeptide repeat protein n=1 Tax=Winogradskyella sp. 3972H.M.0a.05 TaxID=2950277 RepID=UPI0033977D5F
MKKNFFSLVLLLLTFFVHSQSQKKIDSLLRLIETNKTDTILARNYIELANLQRFQNPKLTFDYAKKALKLYEKANHHKGLAKAYFYHSAYYNSVGKLDSSRFFMRKNIEQSILAGDTLNAAGQTSNLAYLELADGNTDTAISMLDSLTPVFTKYGDSAKLANTFVIKSQAYNLKGFSNLSLEASQAALKIYSTLDDTRNIAQSLMLIGDHYQTENSHHKAINSFKEALKLYESIDNKIFMSQAQSYIGDSYTELKNFKEAEHYLNQALTLSKELQFSANIGRTYLNLGKLKLYEEKYDEAISVLNEGLELYRALKIPHNETRARFFIGKAYFEKQAYRKAIAELDKSIAISKQIDDSGRLKDALFYKSLALEALDQVDEALQVYKESKVLSDSIFNIENQQKTNELQVIYETERREQRIALQQSEIDLLEQKTRISNLQKLLLAGGLSLSLLIIGLGLYAFRQKLKRNRLEREKLDSELTFKKKELTTHALHLAQKNEVLEDLKSKAEHFKLETDKKEGYQQLIRTINFDLQNDKNWNNFSRYFEEVHQGFNSKIQQQFPEVTSNDLRLISLLKMNLSNKEIANILCISAEGIKKARYRLRKKMGLSTDDSLEDLIHSV